MAMYADAHIHLVDLAGRDPDFPGMLPKEGWTCCAACHDDIEYESQRNLLARLPKVVTSFGIHPQWPVWKNANLLARLAASGEIGAIGEAGFDFFGDTPERIRNPENERIQKGVFEFQLGLAKKHGLPVVLHFRKAMDLVFAYSKSLASVRALVFHCFSGSSDDARSILCHGMNAWFSFGTPVLKDHRRAIRAFAQIPEDRLLSETDAPWQPVRGSEWSSAGTIVHVVAQMARLRGIPEPELKAILARNFTSAYGIEG